MLDLARPTSPQPKNDIPPARLLVLVDRVTAHPRLFSRLQATWSQSEVILLWVITPSAVLTWGALLAEPAEARTRIMLAALSERMDEAHRRLQPLQRAARAAGLSWRIQVVHGATVETLVRVARAEQVECVLIPRDGGDYHGLPPQELVRHAQGQLACHVEMLD